MLTHCKTGLNRIFCPGTQLLGLNRLN